MANRYYNLVSSHPLRAAILIAAVSAVFSFSSHGRETRKHVMSQRQWHEHTVEIGYRSLKSFELLKDAKCSQKVLFDISRMSLETEGGWAAKEVESDSPWALSDSQRVASELNQLADIEADKGCSDLARNTYFEVIDTYVGSGYEAMRQRSQIGIDDLRASASKTGGLLGIQTSPEAPVVSTLPLTVKLPKQ